MTQLCLNVAADATCWHQSPKPFVHIRVSLPRERDKNTKEARFHSRQWVCIAAETFEYGAELVTFGLKRLLPSRQPYPELNAAKAKVRLEAHSTLEHANARLAVLMIELGNEISTISGRVVDVECD
jgi:hypothetical protein